MMKKTCFISYSRRDLALVEPMVRLIMKSGYDVWFDQHIPGGADWKQSLIDGIKRCDLCLFFMTPDSVSSQWCSNELFLVRSSNKPIIPLLIRPTSPIPSDLAHLQYLDMTTGTPQEHLALLIQAIGVILPVESPASPQTKQPHGKNVTIIKGSVYPRRDFNIGGEHHHHEQGDEE